MTTYTATDFRTSQFASRDGGIAVRIDHNDPDLPWRAFIVGDPSTGDRINAGWRSDERMARDGWKPCGAWVVADALNVAPAPAADAGKPTLTDDQAKRGARRIWGSDTDYFADLFRKAVDQAYAEPRPDGAADIQPDVTAALEAGTDPADLADALARLGYRKPETAAPQPF